MIETIKTILANEKLMPFALAGIAAAALSMAFIAQYIFGLEPCNLCIIQRWPYGIAIGLGVIGTALSYGNIKGTAITLAASGAVFFANAVIAFYHTGVERHWWKSFLEGCHVPEISGNIADVMAQIKAAPVMRCDEIPWADPFLGLSMANYNVMFCLGLAALSAASAYLIWHKD